MIRHPGSVRPQWTVEQALDKADGKDGFIYQREALTVLAAEVRTLRQELEWQAACTKSALESQKRLCETIKDDAAFETRVRGLVANWRADARALVDGSDTALALEQCADELEAELRGDGC